MACQSQGAYSRLSINGQQMEFLTIRGGQFMDLLDNTSDAIRGILDHPKERVHEGLKRIEITVTMNPSPTELDVLLPLIGLEESPTDTFTVDDDFSSRSFTTMIDRVEKIHTYANCMVDKAIFRGQMGSKPITLELTIIGSTAESEGTTWTGPPTAVDTDLVYAFYESTLTLEGTTRAMDRFALGIDNKVFASFNNSQVAECLYPTDREIYFACSSPYNSDEDDLYTVALDGSHGATGSLVWARTGIAKSTTFTFANLQMLPKSPDILGKEEIRLDQYYRCYKSGSTAALVVTHDNTVA